MTENGIEVTLTEDATIKVIRGESKLDIDLLNELIHKAKRN